MIEAGSISGLLDVPPEADVVVVAVAVGKNMNPVFMAIFPAIKLFKYKLAFCIFTTMLSVDVVEVTPDVVVGVSLSKSFSKSIGTVPLLAFALFKGLMWGAGGGSGVRLEVVIIVAEFKDLFDLLLALNGLVDAVALVTAEVKWFMKLL